MKAKAASAKPDDAKPSKTSKARVKHTPVGNGYHQFETRAGSGLLTAHEADGALRVRTSSVAGESKGKGIGRRLYDEAIDFAKSKGLGLSSDGHVTQDAQHVWASLVKGGYKVKRNPKATVEKSGALSTRAGDNSPIFTSSARQLKSARVPA